MTYTKTIGEIRLSAVRHGIGWQVTAQIPAKGIAHTAYGDTIAIAEEKAVYVVKNFD